MERPKIYFKIKVGMNSDTIITLHIAHFSKMNYIKFVNYNVNINFLNYYISEYLKLFPCIYTSIAASLMFQLEMSKEFTRTRGTFDISIENNFRMSHTTFVLKFHVSCWDKILS